jgi:hypothetical protein
MSALAAVLLCGCQTGEHASTTNTSATTLTGPAANAIAGDMVSRFAEQVGSRRTETIRFDTDEAEYVTALEAAFKGWGYVVIPKSATTEDQRSVELGYTIDAFDGQFLARLTTPSIALARAYKQTADGATPASPLSVMRRN